MFIAVNNIKKKEEIDFREKVSQTMKKQIRKKLNNVHSNSISQTDKTIRPKSGDAIFHMEANQESNSTLRTFSSDK